MNEKRRINIAGWGVFVIALAVYAATMAPTASFWDCGEFIACSHELEVTHPPGAPLYLLMGRIFSMLAFNDPQTVAITVNFMSVLAGAFTAMFTCWITILLARRGFHLWGKSEESQGWAPVFAGVIAGLTCTFADSIWWNSVEAEVYAMSSFFTAIVVWLMLIWSERADRPDHLKWIILIAYIMGLSIGVHLLNLLTIPALAMIYYYRKFDFSWKGLFATLGISVAALVFIQYGIIQYTFSLAWAFEKIFTGTITREGVMPTGLGMPMGTGFMVFSALIVGVVVFLLRYSHKTRNVALNTAVLCFSVIMIGFSSYAVIFIRSNANPPVDMNNPENLLSFLSYMKREQYGDRPLLRGPMYNGQIVGVEEGRMKYMLMEDQDRYVEDLESNEYLYREGDKVWFPRMYDPGHYRTGQFGYINYVKNKGADPNNPNDDQPTRGEDLKFFFDYQLRHMYLRYFMWNFAGRASDVQDDTWESGFESAAVKSYNHDSKAKNHYYFLPLLLGLLGLVWQYSTHKRDTAIVGLLFFFTGLAIIVYLNQWPQQPRERDYSYAGSFQTFCIWIGLGVLFLYDLLKKWLSAPLASYLAGALALLAPLIMVKENWDDHTRRGRWVDVEFAYNLLNSCAPHAILFTGGDNDTFPLWYIQEVEGVRTDVRVVNLELLISDWYIDQMKAPINGAQPVPISMKKEDYQGEAGLVLRGYGSKTIEIPLDKEALVAGGVLSEEEASWTGEVMSWDFRGRGSARNPYILRKDSVIIDIIRNVAADNWERPVYFASMMSPASFVGLQDFFRLEGLAYRVVPVKRSSQTPNDMYYGWVGQDIMFNNLLNNLKFTDLDNPDVYFDEHIRDVIVRASYRNSFYRLGNTYAQQVSQLLSKNDLLSTLESRGSAAMDTLEQVSSLNDRILREMRDRLPSSEIDRIEAQNSLIQEMKAMDLNDPGIGQKLAAMVQDNERTIREKQGRIAELMAYVGEHLPDEGVSFEYPDWGMSVQILATAEMEQELLGLLDKLREDAWADLELAHSVDRRLTENDRSLSAILLVIQYYARYGRVEDARTLSAELKALTGVSQGDELIRGEVEP